MKRAIRTMQLPKKGRVLALLMCIFACVAEIQSCASPERKLFRPVPVLTPENTPIFSLIAHTKTGERQLILGLWEDGALIWSDDTLNGGAPFRYRTLSGDHLTGVVHRLWTLFNRVDEDHVSYVRDDAPFIEMRAEGARRSKRLDSWHETFESNTNLVVTSQAVEALAGRSRTNVLASDDEDYRYFRIVWSDIKLLFNGLKLESDGFVDPEETGRYLPDRFVFESGAQ